MKRPRTRTRGGSERFDEGLLTPLDRELLADFGRRRDRFARALTDSNIIHHKHPCPACGFPTLNERAHHEVCVICLWEDGVSEVDPTLVAPPNYTSLMQARIHVSGMLRAFAQLHEIDDAIDTLVGRIKRFEALLRRGEAAVDREDFAANLRNILRATPRGPASP
jgi:hypothetical protein